MLFRSLVHRILDISSSTEYASVESQQNSRSFAIPVSVLALPRSWYADIEIKIMLDVISATFWFLVHSLIVSDTIEPRTSRITRKTNHGHVVNKCDSINPFIIPDFSGIATGIEGGFERVS